MSIDYDERYADSAQAREMDRRMRQDVNQVYDRRSGRDENGEDIFVRNCRLAEQKRKASLPGRIAACIAQMEAKIGIAK